MVRTSFAVRLPGQVRAAMAAMPRPESPVVRWRDRNQGRHLPVRGLDHLVDAVLAAGAALVPATRPL